MSVIMKLGFLIFLAAVVINAAPVEDDIVVNAADGIDEEYSRERRSSDPTRSGIPWYLDRIDQREPKLDGKYDAFAEGTGVDIYILADGIDYDNEEFGGRAREGGFKTLYHQQRCTKYGTELASVAAGRYAGVAKNSNIYSVNLLSCNLRTYTVNVARAVLHVIRKARLTGRRSVLAMPLVGRRSNILDNIANMAVNENIVVVTAAGSFEQNACIYSPGRSSQVINVGATAMENGADIVYKSNYGSCVTLYAPGVNRTSLSCVMVAGAAALVLEKYPRYTPAEVKQYLVDMATDGTIESIPENLGPNKLLFVGNDDVGEVTGIFSGSGSSGSGSSGDLISPEGSGDSIIDNVIDQ